MSFQYTLANLLAADEDNLAVLFLDETGEAVEAAVAEFTSYQMKVVGAYVGIYIRQLSSVLQHAGLGEAEYLHILKHDLNLYATSLPDGYYLVMVQRHPAPTARARRALEQARGEITAEIFGREHAS
jgi:hypothetical protein